MNLAFLSYIFDVFYPVTSVCFFFLLPVYFYIDHVYSNQFFEIFLLRLLFKIFTELFSELYILFDGIGKLKTMYAKVNVNVKVG